MSKRQLTKVAKDEDSPVLTLISLLAIGGFGEKSPELILTTKQDTNRSTSVLAVGGQVETNAKYVCFYNKYFYT